MEEFVPPDIMTMLSQQIGGTVVAPKSNRGSPLNKSRQKHRHSGSSEDGQEYIDLLKNVYQDQHALNHAQKEKIAMKVLKGEYNVSEKFEPVNKDNQKRRYDPFPHQAHSNAIRSRHQLTHRMFEVTSQPVSFQSSDPAVKKTVAICRNKVTLCQDKHIHGMMCGINCATNMFAISVLSGSGVMCHFSIRSSAAAHSTSFPREEN